MKLRVSKGVLFFSIWQSAQIICKIHTFTITFYTFLIATVGTLFVADSHKLATIITQDSSLVVFSIAFGIVGTVIPYLTYTVGLRFIENGKASIIASVEPVVATLLGALLFEEHLSVGGTLGIVLVLAAVVLCNR